MATLEDFAADVAATAPAPTAPTTPAAAASSRGISFDDFAADVESTVTGIPLPGILPTTPLTNNAFSLAQEDARLKRRTRLIDGLPAGDEMDGSFLENLAAGANVSAEGEVATWRKFYGEKNVFVDSDGDIFIRQTNKDGTKQMTPVNEVGPSMADAAKLVLALKDMYLSVKGGKMAGMKGAAGGPKIINNLDNLWRQTAGGVAGSAVGQGGFALAGDDTLAGAAGGIALNATVEGGLGMSLGSPRLMARSIGDWWSNTGSKAFTRAKGSLREAMAGTGADESVMREALGEDLVGAAASRGIAAQEATSTATAGVNVAARGDVRGAVARGTGTPAGLTRFDLGGPLTTRVVDARDAWKAADGAVLDAVRNDPRAQAFTLDPQGLVDEAQRMVERMTRVQRPALGGGTVTDTVAGLNVSGILGRLEAVTSLRGGRVRLTDLMTARTAIGEAVAMGEAVPGTHTGAMSELYRNMTVAIRRGLDDIGDPALSAQWEGAMTRYREAAEFFEQPAFKRIFKEGPQAVAPEEVVASLTDGNKAADTYRSFQRLVARGGISPAEFAQVKRAVADDITGLSLDPSRTDIGAKTLAEKVRAFTQANPEMSQDVFGQELPGILSTLDAAAEAGGRVSAEAVGEAFSGAGLFTARSLNQLFAAQTGEARVFRNAIVKQAVAGTLDPTTITPSKFVSSLLDAKPSDLREVMRDVSDPVTLTRWRQATTTDIIDNVMDARTGAINRDSLLKQLGTPMSDRAQNLRMVLGTDAEATLRRMTSDTGFRSHMSKFMVKVMPSAVGAAFVKFKYRYLAAKVMGTMLADDHTVKWMVNHTPGRDVPPRQLEVHLGTLINQALGGLPGMMTDEEKTPQASQP